MGRIVCQILFFLFLFSLSHSSVIHTQVLLFIYHDKNFNNNDYTVIMIISSIIDYNDYIIDY